MTVGRDGLAIMARPRAGDWLAEEVQAWHESGITVVVSLLTGEEVHDLGLEGLPRLAEETGIEFVSFPIPDRGVPEGSLAAREMLRELKARLAGGASVAVHCRAGIGRSGMIVAALLVQAGMDVTAAFAAVASARGCPVPDTAQQVEWVARLMGNQAGR